MLFSLRNLAIIDLSISSSLETQKSPVVLLPKIKMTFSSEEILYSLTAISGNLTQ